MKKIMILLGILLGGYSHAQTIKPDSIIYKQIRDYIRDEPTYINGKPVVSASIRSLLGNKGMTIGYKDKNDIYIYIYGVHDYTHIIINKDKEYRIINMYNPYSKVLEEFIEGLKFLEISDSEWIPYINEFNELFLRNLGRIGGVKIIKKDQDSPL